MANVKCCEIRKKLIGQKKDEEDGVKFYSEIANEFNEMGFHNFADLMDSIAITEAGHLDVITDSADVLKVACDCEE